MIFQRNQSVVLILKKGVPPRSRRWLPDHLIRTILTLENKKITRTNAEKNTINNDNYNNVKNSLLVDRQYPLSEGFCRLCHVGKKAEIGKG